MKKVHTRQYRKNGKHIVVKTIIIRKEGPKKFLPRHIWDNLSAYEKMRFIDKLREKGTMM